MPITIMTYQGHPAIALLSKIRILLLFTYNIYLVDCLNFQYLISSSSIRHVLINSNFIEFVIGIFFCHKMVKNVYCFWYELNTVYLLPYMIIWSTSNVKYHLQNRLKGEVLKVYVKGALLL